MLADENRVSEPNVWAGALLLPIFTVGYVWSLKFEPSLVQPPSIWGLCIDLGAINPRMVAPYATVKIPAMVL